jgi:ribosomal-protein-alanine N-acetyltransferase
MRELSPEYDSEVTLRVAELRDAKACRDLDRRCFPPEVAYDLAGFEVLCAEYSVRLVAEQHGRIVGMIFAEAEPENRVGLMITVDVDPDFRRRGIGARLMNAAERQLAALGVREVYLHFYTPHDEALRLYRQRGYVLKRRLRSYYGPGSDALLMAKVLG